MGRICDLHTHTLHSDGTLTPEELVNAACKAGISAIALTDHNSVSGLDEFLLAANRAGIIGVPGVEFSTDYEGRELHVHGLFIARERYSDVTEFIGDLKERKHQSNMLLVERLSDLGIKVDYGELIAAAPDGYVNRAHIAVAMLRRGYVNSVREAFDTYLSEKAGYYVPPSRPDVFETISFIRSIGGISVIAHPRLQLTFDELEAMLPRAIEHGLDGIETQYSLYSAEDRERSRELAKKYGLCESGGSDFHGDNKPGQYVGIGRGDLVVPFEIYERLADRSAQSKKYD